MQVGCNRQFCLGLAMDSNDNLTGAVVQSRPVTRTWKDFSPPTSVRADNLMTMAESGNANSKPLPDASDCLDSGISSVGHGVGTGGNVTNRSGNIDAGTGNVMKLEQKFQVMDGPLIRMGTGSLTRRDTRSQPDSLPTKTQPVQMTTWKDMSPPKEKRHFGDLSSSSQTSDDAKLEEVAGEEKNRNPIRTNPFHEANGAYRGTDRHYEGTKRIKTDVGDICASDLKLLALRLVQAHLPQDTNPAVGTTMWRDVSPTKAQGDGRRKRPESGYFSNDVQSEGGHESREEIDTSLSDSECGKREQSASPPGEEACFHSSDYFYEDEFSVQFDTNLRETAGGEQRAPEEEIILPQSLNGSYTKFGGLRDSLLQTDLYLGPYESEMSGSRTSMEISSSEREMMCLSDMINLSNEPLFTPSPPPAEQQQNVSVDSLSHEGQGQGADMGNSRSSNDPNLAVDCCIRKDNYFLSFNGSQEHRSASESEISYVSQTSSHEGPQDGSRSDSSHAEDESSGSFHDQEDRQSQKPPENPPPPTMQYRPVRNMLLSRYPGRICLEALQEYLLDRSHSTKSPGSSRHSCSSHCKLSPLCGTLLSSGDLFGSGGLRRGLRRSSNLTTWKQVKNLRKLGKEQNLHERSRSMPDLTADDVKVVRREKPSRTVESMAESFHTKRHSAYILELYQQLLASSNPPTPTTLSRIDQILFNEHGIHVDNHTKQDARRPDSDSCPSCGARGRKKFHLSLQQDAQCGRSQTTADTEISPQTLTLWYGQKNFSSQFPPNTADCGVQTTPTEPGGPVFNHQSMQTSPASPGTELLHMLTQLQTREVEEGQETAEGEQHKFSVNDDCPTSQQASVESRTARNQQREKPSLPRAKSATECRDTQVDRLKAQMRRTVSLSPSRIGMNSFYTHQSLPDLSFLSGSSRHLAKSRDSSSSAVSLFDPVQIPVILTPVVEDKARCSRSSASSSCGCAKDSSHQSSHQQSRNHRRRRSSSGKSDLTSSGSNYSMSSSSGIDPGYIEPRTHTGLPPELEHLLFLPPHLESAYHQLGLPDGERSEHGCQEADQRGACGPEQRSPTKQASKIERYANEAYPSCAHNQAAGTVKNGRQGRRESGCSSTGSLTAERLGALKEEKTPSPEPSYCHYPPRDYTDHRCFGCHSCSEGESSQELDEEKFQMYQRWLQERKPPLKSCLRKRFDRDQKARSLSCDAAARDEPPEKPPRRQNRHSIACDGMFPVLVDEEGFECQQPPPPPQRMPQTAEYVPLDMPGEKVVLRRKKQAPASSDGTAEGPSQDEINRAKRVSFASEVSFHSPNYTPQSSPRRQHSEGEIAAVEMEDDILTLHVVRRGKTLHMAPGEQAVGDKGPQPLSGDQGTSTEFVSPAATSAQVLEVSLTQSPWDQKAYTLTMVIQAGETLIRHFAQARDPFDKVRLGNAQETPQVGELVVMTLCPAIERVVRDGMKPFLTGLHIFGKIHTSPWRMVESSAEVGSYTRSISDLVKQLKVRPNLVSHRQKFYAFLAGLLNLRLLDFWMGCVGSKEKVLTRFYEDDAVLCLSQTRLERRYQDMLLALQPLAVLPFHIDYDVVAGYSLADSAYMGESGFDQGSPSKSELSSSPKVVVAKAKSRMSGSPDRASWCGVPEKHVQQDASFTDRLDLSATWDWIKTSTLPKARSLMSDMGLMSSSRTSEATDNGETKPAAVTKAVEEKSKTTAEGKDAESGASTTGVVDAGVTTVVRRREGVNRAVKTSRLSQDLASMGIVSSRQSLSASASSTPTVASETTTREKNDTDSRETDQGKKSQPEKEEKESPQLEKEDKEPLPAVVNTKTSAVDSEANTTDVERPTSTLPAVVMDHGTRPNADKSARQKAEEILRRMSDNPALRRRETSPLKTDKAEKAKEGETAPSECQMSPRKSGDGCSSSPQRIKGASDKELGQEGARTQAGSSPKRVASGSPQRGPVINPGSPKIITPGSPKSNQGSPKNVPAGSPKVVHCTAQSVDLIKHVGKGNAVDFPDDDEAVQTPTEIPTPKKEEKPYKEGKTDYTFEDQKTESKGSKLEEEAESLKAEEKAKLKTDVTSEKKTDAKIEKKSAEAKSEKKGEDNNSTLQQSTASSASAHSQAATSPSDKPSSVAGRFSGLRKLSPKGSFNIISFFDRLLLPTDKSAADKNAATSSQASTVSKKESNEDLSGGAQSPDKPEASGASASPSQSKSPSPASSTSSTQSKKSSKIPKANLRRSEAASRQSFGNPAAKTNKPVSPTSTKTEKSLTQKPSKMPQPAATPSRRGRPVSAPEPIPAPVDTGSATSPEFDINANSPDYHLHQQQQPVFVEHNPVAVSQSDTSSTGSRYQSDQSMEDRS